MTSSSLASSFFSLITSVWRTVLIVTVLSSSPAFALESNKRMFNFTASWSSEQDYCHPISTICNLPSTQPVGWVKPFALRSSISIIYSCLVTLFACTWSILQLNVPSKKDSEFRRFIRKTKWMMIALIFPEFIAGVALAELWLARKSKKALKKAGANHWTLTHGYFANMGGFVLGIPEQHPFPLNSETLEILIQEGLLDVPKTTVAEIQDRSKTDSFARTFTILQVFWMVIQCIGRRTQGLYVTPLEFLTSFCIVISLLTYIFEWAKPKDVTVPIVLRPKRLLDGQIVDRILSVYRRLYGKEELKSTQEVTRIPFGAIMRYLMSDDNSSPAWVRILQIAISALAGVYNGTHLWVRRQLFAPLPWKLWEYSCITSVLLPWVFLFQLFLLSNRLRVPLYFIYGAARLLPFVAGSMCFFEPFSSLPVAAYHDVNWSSFIPHF